MSAYTHRDVTQGNPAYHLLRLSWPILISQTLFALPNLYDAIWLGQLGREAQAAAGLTMSVRFTMISVLMALSLGCGAVVARYVGAKDQPKADLATAQGFLVMFLSAGILGLIGVVFARPLLKLAGADDTVLPLAVRYARIIFAGLVALELVPSLGFMINSAGSPEIMLHMTLLSTTMLVIAEPLLVRVLKMGIAGAGLATVGSNVAGMLLGVGVLMFGKAPVRLRLRDLRPDLPMMGRIWRITLPAILQRGTPNFAMSLLTRLVSMYGAPTLAAWVIFRRIFDFAMIPGMGLSRAAPVMVGQNLGAGKPERAVHSVRLIARAVGIITIVVLSALAFWAPYILALFSDDAETIAIGTRAVRILVIGYVGFGINYVFDAAQAGAGDTLSPMTINLISLWLVQVPLAYVLPQIDRLGLDGIWLALVLGWLVQLSMMWLRFRQGRWQLKQI
jgi:putative MATE family efflux protein